MRFGLFYEHQLPRPWAPGAEQRLLADALAQIELADSLGFDCAWVVEHHFLEEYSHSSAPEVFLGAASQRTRRIRLGHGVVQLPARVNHPARVAERAATLDLLSNGRLELGTGESSSASELAGFGVARRDKRAQWADSLDALTRMFVEEPFAGWESRWLTMPPRNVLPKPAQKPHPPLWVACSRRETIHLAARLGLGALSFSFAEPEDAARWVAEYERILCGPDCVPAGFAVNPRVAVVLPMLCHADESTALARGLDGARFFGHSLAHYYGADRHEPGRTDVAAGYAAARDASGTPGASGGRLSTRVVQAGTGSVRGAIGTPAQVRELLERYERAGVDQVIFVMQAGATAHEHICESLALFSSEVMPYFARRAETADRERADRLAPAVAAALARREPPREAPAGYAIDERAELARAAIEPHAVRSPADRARHRVRRAVRRGRRGALAGALAGRSPETRERMLAAAPVQGLLLRRLAGRYRPEPGSPLRTDVSLELTARSQPSREWTISFSEGGATVAPGGHPDASLRVSLPVLALARLGAGELPASRLIDADGVEARGDLSLIPTLSRALGGPSPY